MFIPKVALWIYTVDIEDSLVLDLKKNSWIFSASTLEKKNSPQVDSVASLEHIILILTNQSLLLSAACLGEMPKIPIL